MATCRPPARRLKVLVFFLFMFCLSIPRSSPANTPRQIDGRGIARALAALYKAIKDRPVDEVPIEEVLEPADQPLAIRHPNAKIRLSTEMPIDSVLASPDLNINVYLEHKTHLAAELWKIYFERDGDGWVARRFQALLRAEVGDRFVTDPSEVYRFDALTIRRPAMTFHMTDGYMIPASSSGKVGRVALFGKGRFEFTVTNPVEQQQIHKYGGAKNGQYTGSFGQMALILSHEGYLDLMQNAVMERVDHKRMYKQARTLLNRVDKDYKMKVKPVEGEWSFRPTTRDFVKAEFDTPSRNWLVYSYNPYELEQVSLIQKTGFPRNFKLKPPEVWCRFRIEDPQTASEDQVNTALMHIERYSIRGELEKNKKTLRLTVRVDVLALSDSIAVASFILNEALDVRRVDYADGEGALHIHQGAYLSIPLRTPLNKGERTTFTFHYDGDVVNRPEASFYMPLKNEEWLPRHSDRDACHFDLEIRVPESLVTITTGTKVSEREEEGMRVTHWKSTRPINLLGLTFSDYETVSTESNGVDVTLYTKKGPSGTSSRKGEILDIVEETLPFYSKTFGAYPYRKLDIMQMPDTFAYGQGLPTVLMLWGLYFRSDYLLDRDFPSNVYYNMHLFYKTFLAHELAHQWWGNVVVPRTYRDTWLSEGLATYAADLFIEKTAGVEAFHDLLKEHIDQARQADHEGAITLGHRLKQAYQPVVYDKSAMVLHMLRQVCGDEKFYTILNTFYQQASHTLVTTSDFVRITEQVMNRKMDWFFDQWIRGTGYPTYRIYYTSMRHDDHTYRIQCTLTQSQKGRLFTMPVPIRIELKNGERIDKVVWNEGRYQTFEMVVPDAVKRIIPAPDYAVYCETE